MGIRHPTILQAAVDADGRVRIVIAPRDPRVWNGLDTAGHREGHVFARWLLAQDPPVPDCKVVKWDDLARVLPARMNVLLRRRQAVEQRFA
jgi:hypothetical protein